MTDDELKALVASLAVDQKELTQKMKELTQKMEETEAQMQRTDEKLESIGIHFTRTEEQMQRTEEQMRHTDEQMRLTDEQMRRTDEKLARMGIHLGGITQNQGDVAEEFFFHSLMKDTRLGSLYFDDVIKDMTKHKGKIQEQYDLVMTNGNAIAVIEVKYKAHVNDLQKLTRKLEHFKQLFPIYQSYKLYGGLAAFHINDEAKQKILEQGYFVLQRCGELVQTESTDQLAIF